MRVQQRCSCRLFRLLPPAAAAAGASSSEAAAAAAATLAALHTRQLSCALPPAGAAGCLQQRLAPPSLDHLLLAACRLLLCLGPFVVLQLQGPPLQAALPLVPAVAASATCLYLLCQLMLRQQPLHCHQAAPVTRGPQLRPLPHCCHCWLQRRRHPHHRRRQPQQRRPSLWLT